MDALERQMIEAAAAAGLERARVLEIGGGIGALQAELLAAGAETGEVAEIVGSYADFARELARSSGFDARSTFRVVDVLESPGAVDPADVVVLNRVVCCSPDGVALAGAGARLARRTLLLSFPRDRALVRAGLRFLNAWLRLLGRSFRVFLHPRDALLAAAAEGGLQPAESGYGVLWEFVAFQRTTEARGLTR